MEGALIFRTPETAAVSAFSHDMYFPWLRNNRQVNVGRGGRGVASRVSRHVRDLIWKKLNRFPPAPLRIDKKRLFDYTVESHPLQYTLFALSARLGNKVFRIHLVRATMGRVTLCRANENRKSILADD